MRKPLSAKRLTFRYFSIVAIAIIVVHTTVFELTTEDIEYFYAQNRLDKIHEFLAQQASSGTLKEAAMPDVSHPFFMGIENEISVYFDVGRLPEVFPDASEIPFNQGIEIENEVTRDVYFVMRVRLQTEDGSREAVIAIDNRLYELSEEEVMSSQTAAVTISIILITLSLLVVLKISDKLTRPISSFVAALSRKESGDLSEVAQPNGLQTRELEELVNTFNNYQAKIQELVERERSFSRYASHELRSHLMVMRGALTLMGETDDPAFLQKQRQRIENATGEMSEFIETLLNLTKPAGSVEAPTFIVDEPLLESIVDNHRYLVSGKPIDIEIRAISEQSVEMPMAAFQILVGNLVKNAFAYTESGQVSIVIDAGSLRVQDSGKGYNESEQAEGYGLGLLLVRDICRQYGYVFEIEPLEEGGTLAQISFN